jgi:2,3-bisphosphoglycerate-dependent phosphoglycerate mutase
MRPIGSLGFRPVPTLLLLRHGESEWNSANRFAGWVDVDLTPRGEQEARRSAEQLMAAGLLPDVLHTSLLTRAVRTGSIVLATFGRPGLPTRRDWRLNERCYGALQGQQRTAVRQRYGAEQFALWRRSYDVAPPPLPPGSPGDPAGDPRYADVPGDLLPRTESLADVAARLLPYWAEAIAPDLRAGRTVLVCAHGNTLRALVTHLDGLSREEVLDLNIPTGLPLHYDLDEHLLPRVRGGRYLDPEAARKAAAAVAAQGT